MSLALSRRWEKSVGLIPARLYIRRRDTRYAELISNSHEASSVVSLAITIACSPNCHKYIVVRFESEDLKALLR
jgi:hypothetical protein